MNDTLFIFGVVPATICFVGFVFSLVFGSEFLHWYKEQWTLQRTSRVPSALADHDEHTEEPYSFEPASSEREKELVHG